MDADRNHEHNIASTNVLGRWNVSTAWRQSSAMVSPPPWYAETLVWTLKDGKRDDLIHTTGGSYSLQQHFEIVAKLFDGKPLEDDNGRSEGIYDNLIGDEECNGR